jgi:hypothetical protein
MTILTSTLADLTAAKLIAYYPVPTPGVPIVQPSTDPQVYVNDPSYIKHLNQQAYQKYAVDVPNQYAHDRLDYAAKLWESNKSATSIPRPGYNGVPVYLAFDVNAFEQWWAQYTEKMGDAPPLFFVKPAALPPDPVILSNDAKPAPAPATDGPIGSPVPNNPGVFNPSATDNFPDGYVYAGATGIYQKHIYSNPFTAGNVRIIWVALQLTNPA